MTKMLQVWQGLLILQTSFQQVMQTSVNNRMKELLLPRMRRIMVFHSPKMSNNNLRISEVLLEVKITITINENEISEHYLHLRFEGVNFKT